MIFFQMTICELLDKLDRRGTFGRSSAPFTQRLSAATRAEVFSRKSHANDDKMINETNSGCCFWNCVTNLSNHVTRRANKWL